MTMSEANIQQALFSEVEQAVEAVDKLREAGIRDEKIEIISGMPLSHHILGRPEIKSRVPLFAMTGFIVGFITSLVMNYFTPILYPIYVGGMPLFSIPPTIVLTFEISMLGLMAFTFLGVIWENRFPDYRPHEYNVEATDGKIAVVYDCPDDKLKMIEAAMTAAGAASVGKAEVLQ
jgi:hypothetical protein